MRVIATRQRQSSDAAEKAKERALDQKLLRDARAAGADRETKRRFLLTGRAARE